jgi:hypothetical protein
MPPKPKKRVAQAAGTDMEDSLLSRRPEFPELEPFMLEMDSVRQMMQAQLSKYEDVTVDAGAVGKNRAS